MFTVLASYDARHQWTYEAVMGETPHVTLPIVCPLRTDYAIPLLEGGYTEAVSIS
jgi:hypothetical protein